jgi:hypothetical protein
MLHADLSADLLCTVFTPRTALHDGAVIIRDDTIIAAGAVLPLAETTIHTERFGTRHRAALGITEQTDAVVVVVSEENAQISLVERARIVRNLNEAQLARAIRTLLTPQRGRSVLGRGPDGRLAARTPRLADLARIVGRERRLAGEGGPGPEPVGPPTRPTILPHEPAPRDGAGAAQPGIDGGSTVVPVDELPTTTSSAGAAPSASRTGHAAARRVDGGVRTAEEEPAGRVPS